MAPIRHSRKNADTSNPEKWKLTKLRQKLTHLEISSTLNSSKAELLRIYNDAKKIQDKFYHRMRMQRHEVTIMNSSIQTRWIYPV